MSYEQTAQVLEKFANLEHTIVLVGGQAVNFWANHYERTAPQLAEHAPYTSKDIDFMGSRDAVRECAKRLGGTAKLATLDDMNTPSTGVVVFVDENNHTRQIDFLGSVAGLDDAAIVDTAIKATIDDEHGAQIASFLVVHPVLCLKSRAHNVAYLGGYQTERAKNQLRAAIICARPAGGCRRGGRSGRGRGRRRARSATGRSARAAPKQFALERLSSDPRETLAYNEAFFKIARYGAGVEVFALHAIDVLAAIVDAPGMPEKFYSERLPRARAAVERARAKRFAALDRARARAERRGP
ncbi:MAG TPA: hypothetical protein VF469_32580 [Kofleriaceae bacterium]